MRPGAQTIAAVALLAGVATFAGSAQAGTRDCTLSASGVAFGSITPDIESTQVVSTGAIVAICEGNGNNQRITIELSTGQGSYALRRMTSGLTKTMFYNLYTDPARTVVWGDGSGGSEAATFLFDYRADNTAELDETVYGRVPAQPVPRSGLYADVIVATIIF